MTNTLYFMNNNVDSREIIPVDEISYWVEKCV